jgi:hypothetical protein
MTNRDNALNAVTETTAMRRLQRLHTLIHFHF